MRPSEVNLWRHPTVPLVDTFGRAERELAAAFIVVACRANGDVWGPVTPQQVASAMRDIIVTEPWATIDRQGLFVMPDFWDLADAGFIVFLGDRTAHGCPFEFTELGLTRLSERAR